MKKLSIQILSILWVILLGACAQTEEISPDTQESGCQLTEIKYNNVKSQDFEYDANGKLTKIQSYTDLGNIFQYESFQRQNNQVTIERFDRKRDSNDEFKKERTREIVLNESGYPISEKIIGYDEDGKAVFTFTKIHQYNQQGYLIETTDEMSFVQTPEDKIFTTTTFTYDDENTLKYALRKRTRSFNNSITESKYEYEFQDQNIFKPFAGITPNTYNSPNSPFRVGQRQSKLLRKVTETHNFDGVDKVFTSVYEYTLNGNEFLDKMTIISTHDDGNVSSADYNYVKACKE